MNLGAESIVIAVVVSGALVWAVRAGYRSVKQTGGCSSCSSSGECPIVDNPEALAELTRQGRAASRDGCQPEAHSCNELIASLEDKKQV
jgi:hypothetical protein